MSVEALIKAYNDNFDPVLDCILPATQYLYQRSSGTDISSGGTELKKIHDRFQDAWKVEVPVPLLRGMLDLFVGIMVGAKGKAETQFTLSSWMMKMTALDPQREHWQKKIEKGLMFFFGNQDLD